MGAVAGEGGVITVACPFWSPNAASLPFSRHYTEADVRKLYYGVKRNLNVPFRFVAFVDHYRKLPGDIEQELIEGTPDYGACMQPFRMNEPMILMGLDTVIVGNLDCFAAYAIGGGKLATPRDPFYPETVCNGVMIAPAGHAWVWKDKPAGENDMEWMRQIWARGDAAVIDDLWPGRVVSYKGDVAQNGLSADTRVVYFHGEQKPHQLPHVGWIRRHWVDEAERVR